MQRCSWADSTEPERVYHDTEWGVPVLGNDPLLFEMLTLEGAQAGLSWSTVLAKRRGYRAAFAGFDPALVACFSAAEIDNLVVNPAIVRHRGKVESTVQNAKAVLNVQRDSGSLSSYLWSFVGGRPVQNAWQTPSQVPSKTTASAAMSESLKRRGFGFVGPTTCYAFMQAVGMVNDHTTGCFRHAEVRAMGEPR